MKLIIVLSSLLFIFNSFASVELTTLDDQKASLDAKRTQVIRLNPTKTGLLLGKVKDPFQISAILLYQLKIKEVVTYALLLRNVKINGKRYNRVLVRKKFLEKWEANLIGAIISSNPRYIKKWEKITSKDEEEAVKFEPMFSKATLLLKIEPRKYELYHYTGRNKDKGKSVHIGIGAIDYNFYYSKQSTSQFGNESEGWTGRLGYSQ